MSGGSCVYVPLRVRPRTVGALAGAEAAASAAPAARAQEWYLDFAELRAAFTPRTRAIIINTPQNPTGKMMSRTELEELAAILRDFPRVVAVSDEVRWR